MAVPDFQTMMLPVLEFFSDGKNHTNQQVLDAMAKLFRLSDGDLAEEISSGPNKFYNRVAWTLTYLTNTKLLDSVARGVREITERGKNVLAEKPNRIDLQYLSRFPELKGLRSRGAGSKNDEKQVATDGEVLTTATPDEALAAAFDRAQRPKREEILQSILAKSPRFFELLVLNVLVGAGYGGLDRAIRHLGKSGDGGVDGVIRQDALGLDLVYVQAKRYQLDATIGPSEVREFVGSINQHHAQKGVFITTASFTKSALEIPREVTQMHIALIDGERLIDLMLAHNVGVRTIRAYELKGIDQDYFSEE